MSEPLVLIHGFTATPRTWSPILPALQERHDVHSLALLGHAGTDPWPDGVEVALPGLLDGAERSLDALGLQTAHLVGNSLGGWVALELAARGRARSVVALSPAGGWEAGSPTERKIQKLFQRQHKAMSLGRGRVDGLLRRPRFRKLAFRDVAVHGDRIPAAEARAMMDDSVDCPIYFDFLASVERSPFGELRQIDCPVLIAWGTKDRILPYASCTERLRRLVPQARWRELPGVGHMPQWDGPDATARLILDEVAAASRSPSAAPTSA